MDVRQGVPGDIAQAILASGNNYVDEFNANAVHARVQCTEVPPLAPTDGARWVLAFASVTRFAELLANTGAEYSYRIFCSSGSEF